MPPEVFISRCSGLLVSSFKENSLKHDPNCTCSALTQCQRPRSPLTKDAFKNQRNMNYYAWNARLGEHFFGGGSGGGKRVVMCVTRETLAEVSDLSPEDALKDFVAAVLEGPDWNRIKGCTLIETKVHCCLHVDPQWGMHSSSAVANPQGVSELQDLSAHCYWAEYGPTKPDDDHPDRYPPYLAYLAAFVLAWTERSPSRRGNDYYETVLDLLDNDRERWKELPQFFRIYHRCGRSLTMNDVWADLMRFCEAHDRPNLVLPDTVLRPGQYVDTPKFFGLMKANDLRNLGRLFVAMEERSVLNPEFIPPVRAFVERILNFDQRASYLSNSCLVDLRNASDSADQTLADAYGRLLQAKYRDFDGLPEDEDHAPAGGRARTARLLRVIGRDGSIKVVCRLRSEGALKKLPLEEDGCYVFSGGGAEVSTMWVSGSEWFNPMEVPIANPMGALELQCHSLRLRAGMSAKEFTVLHNPGLYFLAGYRVEVHEVEKGRQYTLLAKGSAAPKIDGVQMVQMVLRCPQGMSCWSFKVPFDATSEGWPEVLPPLFEERMPSPRLSFSGFRLRPRTTRFPVGLPIRISCSVDNVELVATGIEGCELQKEDDGVWALMAQKSGTIALSLRRTEDGHAPQGWQDETISLETTHESEAGVLEFPQKLMDGTPVTPYPEALLELVGGVLDPRCLADKDAKTYFATLPPKIRVHAQNVPSDKLQVSLNGQPRNPASDRTYELPAVEPGNYISIEVKTGPMLLKSECLKFTQEPKIEVRCASPDRSLPTEVANSLVATVWGDDGLVFVWEVLDRAQRVTGGQAMIAESGGWSGVLLVSGSAELESGKTYEVRFGFSGRFTLSQWFKFRGGARQGGTPSRTSGGINSLGNAFQGLSFPEHNEGGKS